MAVSQHTRLIFFLPRLELQHWRRGSNMSHYGKVNEFDEINDEWDDYVERLQQFYVANEITDEGKKKAILLSGCGAKTYKLFKGLCAPQKPSDVSFTNLVKTMKEHQNPSPNPIAERFKFNVRDRAESESVSTYVAELRRLTQNCNFGATLDDMIRDRLVCGIRNTRIQQRLLGEGAAVTLKRALEVAISFESAAKQSTEIQSHQQRQAVQTSGASSVHQIRPSKPDRKTGDTLDDCYRCGGRHHASQCPFKNEECFSCHNKGHTARKCRKKTRSNQKPRQQNYEHQDRNNCIIVEEVSDDENILCLYKVSSQSSTKPVHVQLAINGTPTGMEIDTGASLTIVSEKVFDLIKSGNHQLNVQPSESKLRTYTGELIVPVGTVSVGVNYKGQSIELPLLVVPGDGPSLLGRNWLSHIKLDWHSLFRISRENNFDTVQNLNQILDKHKNVFLPGLGTMKDTKIHIQLKPNAEPKYCKARPVPYALRDKIDNELDRLVREFFLKPVEFSEWATPIVPVPKSDGSIRICGDFKQTVNKAAKCDNYPIPKTEDLFASLGGGEKFTKLDLSQAYLQLQLDDESQEYLTLNTHRGLYRPTRLQFGVHSATGIFQRKMDQKLGHLPSVTVRIDDILISGKNDAEHLQNLRKVLEIIGENNLRLKKSKCVFFAEEVTYLGFKINKKGITPLSDRIDSLLNAPQPQNVSELKSFLGMLNYYHKYLNNIATTLESLHHLLRKDTPWLWGNKQEKSFQQAKQLLCSTKLLVHYDPGKPLLLSCDASSYGLGAVLSHVMPDNSERPIAYTSKTLSSAERNYSQIEKEGLSVVYGIKHFHQYLYGRHFTILTDHKPLLRRSIS